MLTCQKPFIKEEFLSRITQLLESRKRMQAYYRKGMSHSHTSSAPPPPESAFLNKLRQIVLQQMEDENFSVSDLCQEVRLNNNQLYRKLKALTGKTPSLFIRSVRIERALTLLETTSMNVSEVAFAVGFKDPSYFSKVFQQEYGKNPSKMKE